MMFRQETTETFRYLEPESFLLILSWSRTAKAARLWQTRIVRSDHLQLERFGFRIGLLIHGGTRSAATIESATTLLPSVFRL
jgi:hypothetical protein